MQSLLLLDGWQLKQYEQNTDLFDKTQSDGWIPATVPGVVHQDLLAAGQIPDPFFGLQENDVQWIGEVSWIYRCTFDVSSSLLEQPHLDLCFDGLDTFATVFLNNEQILTSDNMFVPHRVSIKHLITSGANTLAIVFASALQHGKSQEAVHGTREVWGDSDPSRVYVRKAQFHYGWDWGPVLLTAGPWREIRLEAYQARITDYACPVHIDDDLGSATLPVEVRVDGANADTVHIHIYGPAQHLLASTVVSITGGRATHVFIVEQPHLWWPHGYGEQPLYTVTARVQDKDALLDEQTLVTGIRRVELVQQPLTNEPGTTFFFRINNTPIYCGGANWIPADSFTTRLTSEHYQGLLQHTIDAHMVMIRVWGGGIYENSIFYELCDRLGLLVWQDFMFACGMYPALPTFLESVEAEAVAQIARLRHHPSIVLWCGNNEDYQVAASINAYDPAYEGNLATSPFPARAIYEQVLPNACAALDGTRPYWPGSPYGGHDANDPTWGDRHSWDVWHGHLAPYQDYAQFTARFVSEFGMLAAPNLKTISSFTEPMERYAESRTMEHHNKARTGIRRVAMYLSDNVRAPATLDDYVYATQFIQAEAVATALRMWRRRWGAAQEYAHAGALIWQLNDCWPVQSWALIDHALRPKAAYYTVRRALAPVTVELARTKQGIAAWAVNATQHKIMATLELRCWTMAGELVTEVQNNITLPPNQATELGEYDLQLTHQRVGVARLWMNEQVIARATVWPEPFKYLTFSDPQLTIHRDGEQIHLRVVRPAKGVLLTGEDGITWSDNMLDLLPDDEQIIIACGLDNDDINVRWLI